MPNHITNKITVLGTKEQIKEVFEYIKIEEEYEGNHTIDFNKITPMPKWVYQACGITMEDEQKFGVENTCLGWARKNWGTKWNAYDQPDMRNTDNTVYFSTAWNGVPKLIQKIAWIFPDVEIIYEYCDEDFGNNLGRYKFKDTEILEEYIPQSRTKEAYELAAEITQISPEKYGLKYDEAKQNYVWE